VGQAYKKLLSLFFSHDKNAQADKNKNIKKFNKKKASHTLCFPLYTLMVIFDHILALFFVFLVLGWQAATKVAAFPIRFPFSFCH